MEEIIEKAVSELRLDKSQWSLTKFGEVAIQQKKSVDRDNTDLTRYVKGEHMGSEDLHLREWGELTDEYLGPAFIRKFEEGDILYGSRRTYLRKVVIAPFEGITSNTTFVIKANEKRIDKRLLPFLMMSEGFTENSIKNSKGSVNPYINCKDIANYEFLLPPKDQQAQLAELLWAMDEVIEKERKVLDCFKIAFQAYSKKYFKEDAKSYIPLSECAEVIMGQSPDGDSYNQDGNGVPLINGPTEFTDRFPIKIQWTTTPTKFCQDRDILLCVRGSTTGRMNISNDTYCIGRGVAAIRGKGIFKTDFLEFALRFNVDEIMRLASGSTFPNIDSQTLKSMVLPQVDNQHQEVIISNLKTLDENSIRTKTKISSSQSLQKSLINQIF
ncbi:MAG: restriction endonuclease subunit S [Saprospiraceae bacterium]|nr:restriction endonuclease subunit S [Saprospiraceae bacterium]